MLNKLFAKTKKTVSEEESHNAEIKAKIATMNLTEMKSYIKNNIKDFFVTTYGLNEVLRKLTTPNEKSKKYYLNSDDMDSKKKKAFYLT